MSRRHAVIRADAGPMLGIGHVMRCLTLADALHAEGWSCRFVVSEQTLAALPSLSDGPHMVSVAADIPPADLLIVDHYGLDATWERAQRDKVGTILVIDDLADRPHDCDLLVDATPGRTEEDYRRLVGDGCTLLLGTAHAMLRPEFAARRPAALARRGQSALRRVLVSVGGMDHLDVSSRAMDALRPLGLTVDVVVTATAPHLARLRQMAGDGITIHAPAGNMAQLMELADLAIGAGGGTAWERCCLGLPTLLVVSADNQQENAMRLQRLGAARFLGDAGALNAADIAAAVTALRQDNSLLSAMSIAAAHLCDGHGCARIIDAVNRKLK